MLNCCGHQKNCYTLQAPLDEHRRCIESIKQSLHNMRSQTGVWERAKVTKAFTLFATHYFELTTLAEEHKAIYNVHLDAKEHGDKIIFLHSIKEGAANQSYGLQVAALAGVPRMVIENAKAKLRHLEETAYQESAGGNR